MWASIKRTSQRPGIWLALLLALFIGLRIMQSLSAVGSFDDEDGFTMSAAWELLHNNIWPYQAYQLSEWENGSLITVLMTVPFCAIFGPSLFALKMAALLISSITLTGLFLLCRHNFGLVAAVLVCLLYIFFPTPVYSYSVTAHGFHPDSMALQLLFLWLLTTCIEQGTSRRRFFLVGLLGGLSVYFAYISVIAVVAGTAPWLSRRLRRREDPRLRLLPYLGGLLAGGLPILIFNLFNQFRGVFVYHGNVAAYIAPTNLAEKLKWFSEFTLTPLLYFANPVDENDPAYGIFERVYWLLALAALLAPFIHQLYCKLLKRPITEGAPLQVKALDRIVVWFVVLTLTIFFLSAHPIGPAHVIPLLLILVVGVACRMAVLWDHGKLVGKACVLLVMGGFLNYMVPFHLEEAAAKRMGISLAMDGRNYALFLYRARDVYDNNKPQDDHFAGMKAEENIDRVRTLILTLPLEHAKNDENLMHHLMVPVVIDEAPLLALGAFIKNPPPTDPKINPYEVAGLTLMQLYLKKRITLEEMTNFIQQYGPGQAARMIEVLGFYLDPRSGLLKKLAGAAAAKRSGVAKRWQESFAFGMGRSWSSRALFDHHQRLCGMPDLPADLQQAFVRGVGFGAVQYMVRPVPTRVQDNICPAMRPAFWQGIRKAGQPSERVLGQIRPLDLPGS